MTLREVATAPEAILTKAMLAAAPEAAAATEAAVAATIEALAAAAATEAERRGTTAIVPHAAVCQSQISLITSARGAVASIGKRTVVVTTIPPILYLRYPLGQMVLLSLSRFQLLSHW